MPTKAPTFRPRSYVAPAQRRAEADTKRGTSKARGYDATWRRLRLMFLRDHPWCECNLCQGKDHRQIATVVDHIQPIEERPELRLEWSNLRAMTKPHHDAHTARTRGFGRKAKANARGQPAAAQKAREGGSKSFGPSD